MTRSTRPHVLVAEDDDALLTLVARWLEEARYVVSKARDGAQVIRAVQETVPSAIVMDVTMPQMDGFQVLAKFRELDLPRVPVLMLTGRNSADDVRKAVTLGAKDYLAKPVDKDQLLARLERMLRKHGLPRGPGPGPERDHDPSQDHYLD